MRIKKSVTRESMRKLTAYDWPGNVRELKNVVERAIILSRNSRTIRDQHLTFRACKQEGDGFQLDLPAGAEPTLEELEASYLKMLLEKHAGHRATVARIMGISERQVYRLIRKYGLGEAHGRAEDTFEPENPRDGFFRLSPKSDRRPG